MPTASNQCARTAHRLPGTPRGVPSNGEAATTPPSIANRPCTSSWRGRAPGEAHGQTIGQRLNRGQPLSRSCSGFPIRTTAPGIPPAPTEGREARARELELEARSQFPCVIGTPHHLTDRDLLTPAPVGKTSDAYPKVSSHRPVGRRRRAIFGDRLAHLSDQITSVHPVPPGVRLRLRWPRMRPYQSVTRISIWGADTPSGPGPSTERMA